MVDMMMVLAERNPGVFARKGSDVLQPGAGSARRGGARRWAGSKASGWRVIDAFDLVLRGPCENRSTEDEMPLRGGLRVRRGSPC
ncbi:hypothetical protein GCM10010460_04860 [Microbacterium terrae]|nr:hypothetical protein GCM10017594_02450 [Microbacterium terrae]